MSILNIFNQVEISHYIYLSTVLFCIGLFGVLFRRNAIILLMCIELMLNTVNLSFTAFSSYMGDAGGQIFVFFIMALAAARFPEACGTLVLG